MTRLGTARWVSAAPWRHAKPSSIAPFASSSQPLQVSVAARQLPYPLQSSEHTREPGVPHVVVQLALVPRRQGRPSSIMPSPSSSQSLHVSVGAVHAP